MIEKRETLTAEEIHALAIKPLRIEFNIIQPKTHAGGRVGRSEKTLFVDLKKDRELIPLV